MKILFDTNVLIAAFIKKAASHEVMNQALHDNELFCPDFIIEEFRRVLAKKFHYSIPLIEQFVQFIEKFFLEGQTAKIIEKICRNLDDNQILADAKINAVDVIITGDRDLLILEGYRGIKIISPNEFWDL